MNNPLSHNEKDMRAVFLGGALILFVGFYFVGKAILTSDDEAVLTGNEEKANELEKNAAQDTIAPDVVRKKMVNNEPISFLDIRSKEAYELEHIPHSIWLSPGAFSAFTPKQNELIVIVASESDTAVIELARNIIKQEQSFTAFFLEGGFEEWKRAGNQTISIGDPNSFMDQSKVTYINSQELKKLITERTENFTILDVQSLENFNKVHIKGSLHIPLEDLEKRFQDLPARGQIIVYGENELVSFQAGVRLADLNFFNSRTLRGNQNLTAASGLPLEP